MISRVITPPTDEPLTVAEVRMHLRNPEITSNDAELLEFIKVAREHVEGKLQRSIITQTREVLLERFPPFPDRFGLYALPLQTHIELPYPPLQSVTSVTYYDADEVQTTLDSADYVVDTTSGWVRLATDASWPSTATRYDAVIVRYVAGWATAEDVPSVIKAYMKLYIEAMDKNRSLLQEREMTLTPFAERLLDPYRILSV